MNGRAFKLGMFSKSRGKPFAAIVLDDTALDLAQAAEAHGRAGLKTAAAGPLTIQALLDDWDRNFAALQEIAAFLDKEGKPGEALASPHRAAAGRPPGQDVLRRAELPGARRRDDPRRHVTQG